MTETGWGLGEEPLADAIAAQMGGADAATVARITAITGLLARVAFSDRKFQRQERELVGKQLASLRGVSDADRKVILGALTINVDTVTEQSAKRYANALRDQRDKDLCLEVLRMLVDVAGADGTIAEGELWNLRGLADAMGLSAPDFERTLDQSKS